MEQPRGDAPETTSPSLLARLRLCDPEAWVNFVTLYSPLIYGWARRGGLSENDAADIVQEVFRSVLTGIGGFQKDGQSSRFRGWLWVITRNQMASHFRRRATHPEPEGGTDHALRLQQQPALLDCDDEPSTVEEQAALVRRALHMIQGDFSERNWQAFWRQAVEGHSAVDVGAALDMSPSAVRQAKYRVLCRLREELEGLEEGFPASPPLSDD